MDIKEEPKELTADDFFGAPEEAVEETRPVTPPASEEPTTSNVPESQATTTTIDEAENLNDQLQTDNQTLAPEDSSTKPETDEQHHQQSAAAEKSEADPLKQDEATEEEKIIAEQFVDNFQQDDEVDKVDLDKELEADEPNFKRADFFQVFDEVTMLQGGVIKEPPPNTISGKPTFVPIFPFLYEKLKGGDLILDHQKALSFHLNPYGDQSIRLYERIWSKQEKADKTLLYRNLQIKISLAGDPLFEQEEGRDTPLYQRQVLQNVLERNSNGIEGRHSIIGVYNLDLDFGNIKEIKVQTRPVPNSKKLEVTYVIQTFTPCTCRKTITFSRGANDVVQRLAFQGSYQEEQQKQMEQYEQSGYGKNRHNQHNQFGSSFNQKPILTKADLRTFKRSSKCRSPLNMGSAGGEDPSLFLNYWNVNQTFLIQGETTEENLQNFLEIIRKRALQAKIYENQDIYAMILPKHDCMLMMKSMLLVAKTFCHQLNEMRLQLRYSILALLSENKTTLFNESLPKLMARLNQKGWNQSRDTADYAAFLLDRMHLELDADQEPHVNLNEQFDKLNNKENQREFRELENEVNTFRQHRICLTPTLLKCSTAQEEQTNRVTRHFKPQLSSFIRVCIVTEFSEKGSYAGDISTSFLGTVNLLIKIGIEIGNLHVAFLGYSNSQLKSHSTWFLCENNPWHPISEEVITEYMGDFSKEKNILKKFARKGQCFSSSKFVQQLDTSQVTLDVEDIKRNGYTFSDGVGYISVPLADKIARMFGFEHVSAFQIRLAGAKGVMMINKKLEGEHVCLRQSQTKFKSDDLSLNVIRCSTFGQGYLNRSIISLLHSLGVPEEFFLLKQRQAIGLVSLDNMRERFEIVREIYRQKRQVQKKGKHLQQEIRPSAANMKSKSGEEGSEETNENKSSMYELVAGMDKAQRYQAQRDLWLSFLGGRKFQSQLRLAIKKDIDIIEEPMCGNVIRALQLAAYQSIKKKARVLMPQSATLIGVCDESGTLEPNEVFIQIRRDSFSLGNNDDEGNVDMREGEDDDPIDSMSQVITGDLLCTRNPCLNPGDLRVVQGVDKPELRHLYNVCVFSTKGERPTCNKMSGGDLDGDVYFVCWDDDMIQHLSVDQMVDPGNYTKPTTVKTKPDGDHLADYFTFYLERDCLGKICNLHVALCDVIGKEGPKDPDCLTLAHLQSIAVDFAKHGEAVPQDAYSEIAERVQAWPDFFEKIGAESYASTCVLGTLYRDISNDQAMEGFMRFDFKNAIKREYELDQRILGQVKDANRMHSYLPLVHEELVRPLQLRLQQMMQEFNFGSEAELFASDLRFKMFESGKNNMYRMGMPTKSEDAMTRLRGNLHRLKNLFGARFEELVQQKRDTVMGGPEGEAGKEVILEFAVAVYLATYADYNKSTVDYMRVSDKDRTMLSFLRSIFESDDEKRNEEFLVSMQEDFELYKVNVRRVVNGDKRMQVKMVAIRKYLSIPWLICPESLFLNL